MGCKITNYTVSWYKMARRNEAIFHLGDEKNSSIVTATELFFEEVQMEKSKFMELFYTN
jgi:hypothetical protein